MVSNGPAGIVNFQTRTSHIFMLGYLGPAAFHKIVAIFLSTTLQGELKNMLAGDKGLPSEYHASTFRKSSRAVLLRMVFNVPPPKNRI